MSLCLLHTLFIEVVCTRYVHVTSRVPLRNIDDRVSLSDASMAGDDLLLPCIFVSKIENAMECPRSPTHCCPSFRLAEKHLPGIGEPDERCYH